MHYRKKNNDLESNLSKGLKGVGRSKNQGYVSCFDALCGNRTFTTVIAVGILLMGAYWYLFLMSQNQHHQLQQQGTQDTQLHSILGNKNLAVRSPSGDHVDMETQLDELLMDVGGVSRRLVDLGAAVRDNDPCFSLIDKGWSGLLVDGDDTQPAKWSNRFPKGDYKGVVSYILADSIVSLLNQYGFHKDIGLLKIDIDSFDCYVMQAILKAGIRPKVIVMETNVKFPPHIRFAMQPGFVKEGEDSSALKQIPFDSEKRGHIYGCSLGYQFLDLMHPNGYKIHYMDWNNVMYVDTQGGDVPSSKAKNDAEEVAFKDVKSWYDYAYWNRPNRNKEFGFNKKISHWKTLPQAELLVEIQTRILPLMSHANQHVSWNGEHYCFGNDGFLRLATDSGSQCSLTHDSL